MKIHGTDARIGFDGVVPFISGDNKATSDESLYGFEKLLSRELDCVEVSWEIHRSDYEELHSGLFKEISQAVKEEPDSVHYAIDYHGTSDRGEISIGFFIVIPKLLFGPQFLVWKDFVLGNKQTKYSIALGVEGFLKAPSISKIEELRKEEPFYINVPTLEEWTSEDYFLRKPLIGKDDFRVVFEGQENPDNP